MTGSGGLNTMVQPISGYGQSQELPAGAVQLYSSVAVETFTSTSGTLSNGGMSVLAPSSAAIYVLPAPTIVGQQKLIASRSASTSIQVTSTAAFIGSTSATSHTFTGVGQGINLWAETLTQWLVVGQSTANSST